MRIAKIIGKIAAVPIRATDIPFRIARELVEDPEPKRGALADLATAIEKAIEQTCSGE